MAQRGTGKTYSRVSVALHWASALLILVQWPIGKFMISGDPIAGNATTLHVWLGLLVAVLTIVRVLMHFLGPKPEPLPMPSWERWLYELNHYGLYIALLLASLTGVGMLFTAGQIPLPGDTYKTAFLSRGRAGDLHEGPANVFIFLLIMHVLGVASYQFSKGRTLRRMRVPIG